jgi:hypothetical protein
LNLPQELTVVSGTPSALASSVRPRSCAGPSPVEKSAMMSEAVMAQIPTPIVGLPSTVPTKWVVALSYALRQSGAVLDTDELLTALKEKGVRNVEIARVLGLPDSRVPEIRDKRRALKLDEGAKLVRAFGLEPSPEAMPLPAPILRLAVRYMAAELGHPEEDQDRLEELIADIQAFGEFVADPKVRRSIEAAEGFFQAMRLRRRAPVREAPSGTDPHHAH